uniref:Uncharacterized protein n=1 Tax=Alexandrium monilatum TaxID=311494 RepID=A0A7S4SGP4_9DINO
MHLPACDQLLQGQPEQWHAAVLTSGSSQLDWNIVMLLALHLSPASSIRRLTCGGVDVRLLPARLEHCHAAGFAFSSCELHWQIDMLRCMHPRWPLAAAAVSWIAHGQWKKAARQRCTRQEALSGPSQSVEVRARCRAAAHYALGESFPFSTVWNCSADV